ncbi:DUF962 domain-containing protein [Ramlibacter solisilvae]|uniref:Membrane protein n=1 Tax=Ramlibacter tataouinensis TaxID=94132 RepID=A0A127JSD5_9BURK|nr:DUF962 domain-containing protein [Ramlibacter tataouinensis]AMO22891.1 membrane protein [Ramlibacter tataouinensis]
MQFDSFSQFYRYYLTQHSNSVCRTLHFIGLTLVLAVLAWTIATGNWWALLAVPVIGYGFAWVGHFGFEKNKPASFGHPFYSLASDWVMWWHMLTGKVPFSGSIAGPKSA